jgi:Fis family transcriptional regulator
MGIALFFHDRFSFTVPLTGLSCEDTTLKRELDGLITQMHSAGVSYTEAIRQFKRRYILEVLAHHKGNQCKAAEELGMHRNTLSRTLAELELNTAKIRNGMRRPPMSERPRTLGVVANMTKLR